MVVTFVLIRRDDAVLMQFYCWYYTKYLSDIYTLSSLNQVFPAGVKSNSGNCSYAWLSFSVLFSYPWFTWF